MRKLDPAQLTASLQEFIERARSLRSVSRRDAAQEIFDDEVKSFIQSHFGSDEAKTITDRLNSYPMVVLDEPGYQRWRQRNLEDAINFLEVLKARLNRGDYSSPESASRIAGEPRARPRVFISHSGEPQAFYRLDRFLRDLGIDPVVAEWLPFRGRQVPEHARNAMKDCEAAIVFATRADQVGERSQPGRGALIETGILQERFGERVVYLVEEGAEFGPMADSFACESFSEDCLERAFHRIVVELKAHGLI